jgi:SRSO17 transposase
MSHFDANVSIINTFCDNFKKTFSKKQFPIFRSFVYGLIGEYKRVNLNAISKTLNVDYGRLQYFLSDSDWDYDELNTKRILVLNKQRTTGFNNNGLLLIDDTGVLKPYAAKTEGARFQHCPVLGGEAVCNIGVASALNMHGRYIPLDVKFYKTESEFTLGKDDPAFKSKLDFAKELIQEACDKDVPFAYCVFDSWYGASDVLTFIHEKNLKFLTEIKSDRKFYFKNPESQKGYFMQQDELVTLVRKHFWHKVRVFKHRGRMLSVYAFETRLKKTHFPVKVFLVLGSLSGEDSRDVRLIISNDLKLPWKDAVVTYMERWAIERLFRELKDSLGFDQYQVRHKLTIMRYWMLVLLVWSLIYWIRQNGYLYRSISSSLKGKSINECKQVLLKLVVFSCYTSLTKNRKHSVMKN